MTPRLTIAIPTLNRAHLFTRALRSALAQTSRDVEIIVSDNGSVDETPAVIAQYAGRSGLRTFRHESTIEAARHGQFLIEQAQGEFFVGLSDDDFLEPEFATEALHLLDRRPDLSFVYTGANVHYDEVSVPSLVGPEVESGLEFLNAYYSGRRELMWCACATRVQLLRRLGPQPTGFVLGDMFFWTKMAFEGPVGCIPRYLSNYVLLRSPSENDNMSHGTRPLLWARQQQELADAVQERSRRAGADDRHLKQLANSCRLFGARSTANQFVWARIRGAGWRQSFGELIRCASFVSWSPLAWSRALAALLLPPSILRALLLQAAARLARVRIHEQRQTDSAKTAHVI